MEHMTIVTLFVSSISIVGWACVFAREIRMQSPERIWSQCYTITLHTVTSAHTHTHKCSHSRRWIRLVVGITAAQCKIQTHLLCCMCGRILLALLSVTLGGWLLLPPAAAFQSTERLRMAQCFRWWRGWEHTAYTHTHTRVHHTNSPHTSISISFAIISLCLSRVHTLVSHTNTFTESQQCVCVFGGKCQQEWMMLLPI